MAGGFCAFGGVLGEVPGNGGVGDRADQAVGLRPSIERAFEHPRVTIDFAGLTGETLLGALEEPVDRIRRGRLTPESISIRLLIPDMSQPLAVPSRAGRKPGDDPAVRGRVEQIAHRSAGQIIESIEELGNIGLVQKANVECRVVSLPMMFKLYLLNEEEVFFGFYPVVEREVRIDGKNVPIFDAVGKDTVLFHHSVTDDDRATGSQYVDQARSWFESVWGTIGRTHTP